MGSLFKLRLAKVFYSLFHPVCWRALRLGVAPSIEHQRVLSGLAPDLILDVGANRGQFSLLCRVMKAKVPIIAFEPIPTEANTFARATSGLQGIHIHQVALGEKPGRVEIHISQSADSSSLLPIGRRQEELFPATNEVCTLIVPVNRLDDYRPEWEQYSEILLKIDVQGFELNVLKGAIGAVNHCAHVYVECSHTELYVGQPLFEEVEHLLNEYGFHVQSKHNQSIVDGQLIQADYLFARNSQ